VYAPANGYISDYYGIELAWQHILDNGFGAHMQYTRTWNRSYDQNGNSIPPVNASRHDHVAGLFYDKGHFSADVNWDYAAIFNHIARSAPRFRAGGDHESVPVGHGQRALQDHQGTPGLCRRQEPHRFGGSHLSERQPLVAVGAGQSVGQSSSGVGYGYAPTAGRIRSELRINSDGVSAGLPDRGDGDEDIDFCPVYGGGIGGASVRRTPGSLPRTYASALWPGAVPDAIPDPKPESVGPGEGHKWWARANDVSRPTMTVYAAKGRNTGAAVVVFPAEVTRLWPWMSRAPRSAIG